jgi:hypothetical protein
MLSESKTYPGCYSNARFPGRLQYSEDPNTLSNLEFNFDGVENNPEGYQLVPHTDENLSRVVPHTKNMNDWKILFIMYRDHDGTHHEGHCLKAALVNNNDGKIALLTSVRSSNYSYRTIKSHDEEWRVSRCRMLAMPLFWKELKHRIENYL